MVSSHISGVNFEGETHQLPLALPGIPYLFLQNDLKDAMLMLLRGVFFKGGGE